MHQTYVGCYYGKKYVYLRTQNGLTGGQGMTAGEVEILFTVGRLDMERVETELINVNIKGGNLGGRIE